MSVKSLQELIDERFEHDSQELPVFNRVALQLRQLRTISSVTMKQVTELILQDQALASRILKVANSSFYGGLKQVDTLSGAVMRLGMGRVVSLAMVAAQMHAHSAKIKIVAEHMPQLWRRAYFCAIGARWVAEQSGHGNLAEEAFLCALLHDVGELFLLKALERLALDKEQAIVLNDALIREILESMHNAIGGRLMEQWNLPEHYVRVARAHHDETCDPGDILLVSVRLLDIVCRKLGIGQPADPSIVLAATEEALALGLKEIKLAQLEVMLEDLLATAGPGGQALAE